MSATYPVHLPPQYIVNFKVADNSVQQLLRPAFSGNLTVSEEKIGEQECLLLTRPDGSQILVVSQAVPDNYFFGDILRLKVAPLTVESLATSENGNWLKIVAPRVTAVNTEEDRQRVETVLNSWQGQFYYRLENPSTREEGLRPPQLGALFATLAHRTVSPSEPATIVMPTGTGKTETMLALLVDQKCPCILVVVPNNALREQIANKFLTLGILKRAKVVGEEALFPIVGLLEHQLPDGETAEAFLRSCNVIVATMQAINTCSEEVRRKISDICSDLIVDEAHHVKAPSWDSFRRRFHGKPIIQFTATPFRNDGKHVGGKMIYSYPLRKAQQEGYFKPIRFRPVYTFLDADRKIAEQAVEQLREDSEAKLEHLIMARVNTIERAKEVHALYQEIASEHSPLCIHSETSPAKRREALKQLRDPNHPARIIVCVNMLGEGFDLPQLKIAALHDIHKSLAITLQFTGRFTRTVGGGGPRIGDATMIANRARLDVREQLRALYAEDADWNQVIRELGEDATNEEEQRSIFQNTFNALPVEVPIQNLEPKMSTVVYRTGGRPWNPDAIEKLFPEESRYTKEIARSEQHHVIWFVTREVSEITWGEMREIENATYHLYLIHWDEEKDLLFINSSNNGTHHEELAEHLCGDDVALIRGNDIYRAMHNITRLVPTNLGLLDLVSRTRRFMMLVGADTTEGLDPAQSQSKTKTNLFGYGFEKGERISIGCSLKGRIWSFLVANDLSDWVEWCHHVGAKLLDEDIDTAEIFRNFVKPVYVHARPDLVPLAIEWPLAFLSEQEDRITVIIKGEEIPFYEAGMEITDHTKDKPILFRVLAGAESALYQISFGVDGTRYLAQGDEVQIRLGKRIKPLSEWFRQYAPRIHFEQDTFIEHDLLLRINRDIPPFDPARIEAWTWNGINIKKESQTSQRVATTVQFRTIENIVNSGVNWDIIFDDDDAGEVADVVAIRMDNNRLIIHLYHCKYSGEENVGSRVDDFYVVCGQAQKSVHWRERSGLSELIPHLIHREQQRLAKGEATRFEKGNFQLLDEIARRLEVMRPEFKIFVVQPGLSKAGVSNPVLELLASTSLYLHETFNIEFGIISSD